MSDDITLLREENARLRSALDARPHPRPAGATADPNLLANLGHELRTPLTIIRGLSELLLDMEEEDAQRDFLRQIHDASRLLGELIENALFLTKLQAGYLDVDPQALGLGEACAQVISQRSEALADKHLRVTCGFPSDLPPVLADGRCLELVLRALLDNAIKFNHPGGSIHLEASAGPRAIQLAITDSGVGFPPEKLATPFELFGQADTGMTRRYGGLGLGLPLVKRLLDLLGGQILIESPAGAGSTVTIGLPRA